MFKNLLFFFSLIILFTSCEEKPVDIPEFSIPDTGKTILIEELTGVSCPNCPAGSARLQSLIELFGGSVIGVSIHGDFLSEPTTGSIYDFRINEGVELESYLAPWFGKPCASFNRVQKEGASEFAISNIGLWQQFAEEELNKPQTIEIQIGTEYNQDTRELNVSTGIVPLENIEGDLRISVMLTESHIIDVQEDVSEILQGYEHNHVLRTMLTPYDGETLADNLVEDVIINKNFSYIIPDEEGWWVPENMEVIVFVALVTESSKEILQSALTHVIE